MTHIICCGCIRIAIVASSSAFACAPSWYRDDVRVHLDRVSGSAKLARQVERAATTVGEPHQARPGDSSSWYPTTISAEFASGSTRRAHVTAGPWLSMPEVVMTTPAAEPVDLGPASPRVTRRTWEEKMLQRRPSGRGGARRPR